MIVPEPLQCLESNRDFFGYFLNDANFCAGGVTNMTTACIGDSGGGMFFRRNGLWFVRGIISIGLRGDIDSGCRYGEYFLLTDVAKHLSWIKENL